MTFRETYYAMTPEDQKELALPHPARTMKRRQGDMGWIDGQFGFGKSLETWRDEMPDFQVAQKPQVLSSDLALIGMETEG